MLAKVVNSLKTTTWLSCFQNWFWNKQLMFHEVDTCCPRLVLCRQSLFVKSQTFVWEIRISSFFERVTSYLLFLFKTEIASGFSQNAELRCWVSRHVAILVECDLANVVCAFSCVVVDEDCVIVCIKTSAGSHLKISQRIQVASAQSESSSIVFTRTPHFFIHSTCRVGGKVFLLPTVANKHW